MAMRHLLVCAAIFSVLAQGIVLSTKGRWIVDPNGQRVKLRCVNWAGAGETHIPEGLASQPVDTITKLIADGGFNCVRLTYSIDMALDPDERVSTAFNRAAAETGQSSLTKIYDTGKGKNSFLASGTTRGAFEAVINSLNRKGILVILDNHTSKAQWCCGTSDGNGWWASASGYNDANSRYFDTENWLSGLSAMAIWSKSFSNVVALSLRNELRAVGGQDGNSHADWYKFVSRGAKAIHSANPNALVVVGGVNYALDFSFMYSKPLDRASLGLSSKVLWEYHSYSFSTDVSNCANYQSYMGNNAGYLLAQGKPYTGPLWLSEFGFSQTSMSSTEKSYWDCLRNYIEGNDADWAYWAVQGNYYIREGEVDYDETFGLLSHDWSVWRNPSWRTIFGDKIFRVNQTP
ncbi:glycosyl hydrolase family 5 protein/cellulase [Pseudovirgaria hyperparasitica]|uniref:Glycosyl hydrolase family 5 protein/cellulase n=1 Tax=Pseudovirgaria hyperparasitica TaxID=470096 RepID=A0A6A6WFT6_9PEZI|nr:glycosyl hydrolase family 5 protein/cellulase [Pseudovirgaria hyperparasitica]KAF2760924.1 glycosyl hydrolase family 5 protein/cellulase [Pseudovirgaria hyperparasitica]